MQKKIEIQPAKGKLGILMVGLGAVSTTFVAGVLAARKGLAKPFGSLTQMGTIRLGKRTDHKSPLVKDFAPLASLDDIVFGAWDIFEDNAFDAALKAGVLDGKHLLPLKEELTALKPWKAVFDKNVVKKLDGTHVKQEKTKWDLALALMEDIRRFKEEKGLDRVNMIWCASTEAYTKPQKAHANLESFEKALKENDPAIPPSMIYAYAALKMGIPF